ncbi:MAG: SprT family zinc-dependent metalloprotease [Pseudomonadota bacterium]
MLDQILDDIPITLRRSARARRITLRVSQLDGRVTLTLPANADEAEGLAFLQQKAGWIRARVADLPKTVAARIGAQIPVEGVLRELQQGEGRRVVLEEESISVPGRVEAAPRKVQAFLKMLARERLAEACDLYAGRLGRPAQSLSLRDPRSRWGSCSNEGRLMFAWRLIMAPPQILRYVAAHEVAHLMEMNHSAAFWDQVRRIHGDYAEPRRWLRENGARLHRYQFAD